ncbi:MAG: DUF2179 domain-containing protein, partial [Bacilli bacterium]|nr:DUF2179 domain-containing protein [Bacilli bacterium]
LIYLFIFIGKLIEVALSSLRSQLIHKGQRLPGAIIALFEYAFWLMITATVLQGFTEDPIKIIVLVVAFASGHVLGSWIEEKMGFGYSTITSFFADKERALHSSTILRRHGFALTLMNAEGMQGEERTILLCAIKRKHVSEVKRLLYSSDPEVVMTVQYTQQIKGSLFLDLIK